MGKTIRKNKGNENLDKTTKKKTDRKRFVYEGEGYTTKAQGGIGNKRAWVGNKASYRFMPKPYYKALKERLRIENL